MRGIYENVPRIYLKDFHNQLKSAANYALILYPISKSISVVISFRQINKFRFLQLNYKIRLNYLDYSVPLLESKCNIPGTRYWFKCPNQLCANKCTILYLCGEYFVCRNCCKYLYENQRESKQFRDLYCFTKEEQYIHQIKSLRKRYYQGKETKRYILLKKRLSKSHRAKNIVNSMIEMM